MDTLTSFAALIACVAAAGWVLTRLVPPERFVGSFLRFDPDLGWPRGVQEDDDLKWRWDRSSDSPAAQRPRGSGAKPPVRPEEVARLQLPMLERPDREPSAATIVDWGVTPVAVAPVERRH
jgi:hypothetical protein